MRTLSIFFFAFFIVISISINAQNKSTNNVLTGKVFYLSSGNKPAVGVQIKEKDSNGDYSKNNGAYRLTFQTKRNGDALAIEIGTDIPEGKKIELVNEKEVKSAKLPANAEEALDIIICFAGQRDLAAQKYYRILRTAADRELERKKQEIENLIAQKEKDYQRISDLFAQVDKMQEALDSAKIREQAFNIASINIDRASQLIKDAVKKIDEENDVDGALKILNTEALDTAYEHASALKKKADAAIQQVIEGYEFRINLLEPQFKYAEIAECYEKIVGIYEKEEYDKKKLATYISNSAYSWQENGDYHRSLEFNLKALAILNEILPSGHPDIAWSFNRLAVAYTYLGKYDEALEYNLKALKIIENSPSTKNIDLAGLYSNMSLTYNYLGKYKEALEYNLKAIKIEENDLSATRPNLAASYNNLALTYNYLGEYKKALESNLKALAIRKDVLPIDHPDLARSYNNLADTYGNLGEYQKTVEFNLNAFDIWQKILPKYHPDLVTSYNNLAIAYGYIGKYEKALEFSLIVVDNFEKNLSFEHPLLARAYNNLALAYENLGNYQKALEFNLKGLDINNKIYPSDHPEVAGSYNRLAMTYTNLEEYQKALEFNLKALAFQEKNLPDNHSNLATSYNNIAVVYSYLRNYPKALEYSLKALDIWEQVLSAGHPSRAILYTNIGNIYGNLGKNKECIEYSQKAIQIGETSDPKLFNLNRLYINLAVGYLRTYQYQEAKDALKKSENFKIEEIVYRGWARYYALQKKKKEAIESLQKAITFGFKDLKWLETESDLKNIRKEKGYKELVEQLKQQQANTNQK